MVDEQFALRDRSHGITGLAVLADQSRLCDAEKRRMAQLAESRQTRDVPEVVHSEQPVNHVELVGLKS